MGSGNQSFCNLIDITVNRNLLSHPKYRAALKEKLPFLVCGETESSKSDTASQATVGTVDGMA